MSAFSLPVTRPTGRGLLIGREGSREGCAAAIQRLGFTLEEREDPYTAMAEIARRGREYSAVFVMLGGLFRQELPIISAIKSRYSHLEVWLAQTDGRQAAMKEAVQLGADGLLTDEGLHRLVAPAEKEETQKGATTHGEAKGVAAKPMQESQGGGDAFAEPILTAEELRALLQEPPTVVRTGVDQ